jgi:hypothetical protein
MFLTTKGSCERSWSHATRRIPPLKTAFQIAEVILGVMGAGSVHKVGYGQNFDWAA